MNTPSFPKKPPESNREDALPDSPGGVWPDWTQQTGAATVYPLGARAAHRGRGWVSLLDHNPYEPGVYGWAEELTAP